MGKADALSQRSNHGDGTSDNQNIVLLTPSFFAIQATEAVHLEGPENTLLSEIRQQTSKGSFEDSVSQILETLTKSPSRSLHASEWQSSDGLLYFRGKIYVPPNADLYRRIVSLHHDSKIRGHKGHWKTLELVSQSFWWPQISRYIGTYVSTCDSCLRTKPSHAGPTGELQPLPVPTIQ